MTKEKQITELGRQARDSCLASTSQKSPEEIMIETEHNYTTRTEEVEVLAENIDLGEVSENCFLTEDPSSSCTAHKPPNPMEEENSESKGPKGNDGGTKRKILGLSRRRTNQSSSIRKNALQYLTGKEEKDRAIRMKELELQERQLELYERKLALEEKKFQLEADERRMLMEITLERNKKETAEREQLSQVISSQQKLIDSIVKKLN